jgi:hypothetical protein
MENYSGEPVKVGPVYVLDAFHAGIEGWRPDTMIVQDPIGSFDAETVISIMQGNNLRESSSMLHHAIASQINYRAKRTTKTPIFNKFVEDIFHPEQSSDVSLDDEGNQELMLSARRLVSNLRIHRQISKDGDSESLVSDIDGTGAYIDIQYLQEMVQNDIDYIIRSGLLTLDGDNSTFINKHLNSVYHKYILSVPSEQLVRDGSILRTEYENLTLASQRIVLLNFFQYFIEEEMSPRVVQEKETELSVAEKPIVSRTKLGLRGKFEKFVEYGETLFNHENYERLGVTEAQFLNKLFEGSNPFVQRSESSETVLRLVSFMNTVDLEKLYAQLETEKLSELTGVDCTGVTNERQFILFELLRRELQNNVRTTFQNNEFVLPSKTVPDWIIINQTRGVNHELALHREFNADNFVFDNLMNSWLEILEGNKPRVIKLTFGEIKVSGDSKKILKVAEKQHDIRMVQFLHMLFVRSRKDKQTFHSWLESEDSCINQLINNGALEIDFQTELFDSNRAYYDYLLVPEESRDPKAGAKAFIAVRKTKHARKFELNEERVESLREKYNDLITIVQQQTIDALMNEYQELIYKISVDIPLEEVKP